MEQRKFSRVKIESILSVVSGKPTEPGKFHKLSLVDQALGLHTIHVVFYYRSDPFQEGQMSSELDNLRVTLSQLLDEYPIVTGRLARGPDGGWQVKCNDAGVRLFLASVGATLDEWLRSADASEERDLTLWEDMPHDPSFWSPFRVQINNFKCGGLAIGLSCTHMHTDITSATLLIKSWTEVHRGQPLTRPPIFNLPSLSDSQSDSLPSLSPLKYSNTPAKMGTATMKFSSSMIEKCLSQVQNHCPNATPFDVLAALFWSRIAQWQEPRPDDHKRSLSVCVDFRNQGHSSIPYAYFGNALHFSELTVDADKLLSGGLGQVSDYVHRHVAGLQGKDFASVVSWLDEQSNAGDETFRMYGRRLTCINTEHMVDAENGQALVYAAMFKKGERPVHVSYHFGNVGGEGLIMVMPSAEGGRGRTVTVMLPEEQVVKLCKDQAIQDLEPTMLLSGKR